MSKKRLLQQEDIKILKLIAPTQIPTLEQDEMLVVNRIKLNSHLFELELWESYDYENIMLMRKAIKQLKEKDKETKRISMGIEMPVRDILKVFKGEDFNKMPQNTFALLKY